MFINKLFGKESKPKAQKDQDTKKSNEPDQSTTTEESLYDDYCDINYEALGWKGIYETRYRTLIPRRPIPEPPTKNEGKLITKHAIVNLPLQHVSSNRRIEDLDDDEYGYEASSVISRLKKKDTTWEEAFVDAHEFLPYQKDSHSFMISKFFFFPRENYEKLSIGEICRTMEEGSTEVQQDLSKYVTAFRLPNLKRNNRIAEIFNFLSCKEKSVKHLCINKLTEVIMDADQRKFTKEEMKNLYKTGTTELFTVISETKKTAPIFQSLIQLGIMFNCFIYLRAIEAVDDWIPCIQNVLSAIQSKKKRVMERNDLDVIIFAKMARCMFELEAVDFDESLLMGEDMDDFLPPFNREDNAICIEGLAALFHTGNLVLRQQSKFNPGVQKMVVLSSFMDGYTDEGMRKWYHRLLDLFIVHILQREHSDVKLEVLVNCENQLLSILNDEGFSMYHCLLFHHNKRIRSRYKEITKRDDSTSKTDTEDHIQTGLSKCGLVFNTSPSVSPLNIGFERKQCTFCKVDASITCIFEVKPDEPTDLDVKISYTNSSTIIDAIIKKLRRERLENELDVLKEIEFGDMDRNVVRLLAFNQSSPKFYIKEKLPGDNLQRRLLKARDEGKKIPITDLIGIIVQAVQAIIYVHSYGCLVRDITTASFGCTLTENGYVLKLKNFEMAAKPSDFPSGGIVCGLIDLDFDGVPIRWAAPESLLKGFYSIYSDVWSVNILADEILNYAAWPYSDIIDSDIDDMVTNIVFTHLKPQGFNRPRRVQGLILEGLASEPDQRLKLEALRERLLDISHNVSRGKGYSTYDTYSGVEGTHAKVYDIPPLTERQIKPNSVFERGIPESIQRYRAHEEDSMAVFASKLAEDNERLREQDGIPLIEITSDEYYKIVHEDKLGMMKVMEKVSDDFLKFTYNRLKEIDSRRMCVEPWPPTTSVSEDGSKQLHYKFPRSTHLLDIALHKQRGDTIGPYIELLYELANHIDFFHSAGWIFRSLRAKHVWILETKEHEQTIVVPKFGKYRVVASSDYDIHLEQIKVERLEETDGIQWLPIEAIKAGLYSKESDVYAFGMITWEIMSAFGQEGIVYDKDEERELTCIPFNYQQSANILQHLIKGYIPEKHVKCPDWFYQEVTRPCLLHQKIDRPSMKTILQILSTRLGKSLPKQILSLPPLPPPPTSTWSTNCPVRLPRQPSERYPLVRQQISEDVDSYEEVDSLTHLRTPPPLPPVLYHNTKERKNQDRVKRILPLPPKPKDVEENDTEEIPTLWIKGREAEENVAEDDVTFISPPIPRRPPPPAPTGNQIESTETTDEKSCKTLPLPKLPESSIKTLPLPKLPESSINLSENTSAPTLPPKPQCAIFIANQDSINIHKTSDYLEFPLNTRSQIWDNNKGSCNERKASLQSVEDTEGGSGNERKASLQSVKDTDRGSGNERKASLQSVEDTERGSDFDRTSGLCHAQQVDNSLGDTQRGSDFYGELTNIEKQSSPYVNETGTDTKPILPPRKPLNK
ncbi:uncharacterized protein LOC125670011 isoform X2 [Ostrea edulis]|uniref:uncharacterized protein LOC125670011 isoform X2 n=1 Tax=Ostrea edulis TaxID=37623 RepID=UPI0024AF6C84|nr:uncharacterized protein LOC125670011 isoform X2 [Ostrea edulis]